MDPLIHESWRPVLAPYSAAATDLLQRCESDTWPPRDSVFRALSLPLPDVRVVIVGQDPYPTPGHAHGLAFSVPAHVTTLPKSLANIFRELQDDLGSPRTAGNLEDWVSQGVLLLNRVLTVRAGAPGSHRGRGWEPITEAILRATRPDVAILWGNDAASARPFFPDAVIIASPHPSPLSAYRGFFGSKPFSRANAAIAASGHTPIAWT